MSARNPTSFIVYPDDTQLLPRKEVLVTVPNQIVEQQIYALDAEEMILSDFWMPITVDNGTLVTVGQWTARPKDMCADPDFAGTYNWKWAVYAWAAGTVSSFEVKLINNTASTSTTQSISATLTTKSWRGFYDLSSQYGSTAQDLELQARRTGGTGEIYIAGIGVFAPET